MNRLKTISVLLFVFIVGRVLAVDVDVRIFSSTNLKKVNITPLSGKYVIYNLDKKVSDIYKNNTVTVSVKNGKVSLTKAGEDLGLFDNLYFSAEGFLNTFTFSPMDPYINERVYDDGIKISVNSGYLIIVNKVEIEHYVAGVTESEGGICKNLEFLKVQSIISRTYAISNLKKHSKIDGYNFCDNTHCQVYKGRSTNTMIMMATSQTNGDIIVDQSNKPISAAFHSNCGGQTANSEDVWSIITTYLKSVKDTFCLKKPHAKWEKEIPKKQWLDYLSTKFNYPINDSLRVEAVINFEQKKRKINLDDNPDVTISDDASTIPLKTIRTDWKLNSTLFNIKSSGDTLNFVGKGFGHGVGLCQEGAMRMADLNWTAKEIIKFYFKEIFIINILELKTQ